MADNQYKFQHAGYQPASSGQEFVENGYFKGAIPENSYVEPIRSMNWIHAMWANIQFDCSSKGLPSFKDAPTSTVASDNTGEFSARTIVGKSEGLEVIELVVETDPIKVYQGLLGFYGRGVMADLLLTYITRSTTYQPAFGYQTQDDREQTVIDHSAYYPTSFGATVEGTYDQISELTIVVPKCSLVGLAPAGGENNSASNTTVKLQPEGGPVVNLPYLIQTKFYNPKDNTWAYQVDGWETHWNDATIEPHTYKVMQWGKAWDGKTILDDESNNP